MLGFTLRLKPSTLAVLITCCPILAHLCLNPSVLYQLLLEHIGLRIFVNSVSFSLSTSPLDFCVEGPPWQ